MPCQPGCRVSSTQVCGQSFLSPRCLASLGTECRLPGFVVLSFLSPRWIPCHGWWAPSDQSLETPQSSHTAWWTHVKIKWSGRTGTRTQDPLILGRTSSPLNQGSPHGISKSFSYHNLLSMKYQVQFWVSFALHVIQIATLSDSIGFLLRNPFPPALHFKYALYCM
jgi:hypothetical protein